MPKLPRGRLIKGWSLFQLQKARNINFKFILLEASNRNKSKEQQLGSEIPHFHTSMTLVRCRSHLVVSMKLSKNDTFSELCLAQKKQPVHCSFKEKRWKINWLQLHFIKGHCVGGFEPNPWSSLERLHLVPSWVDLKGSLSVLCWNQRKASWGRVRLSKEV